jgi:DNA (cytosine-5)-methyltransferase 1
MSWLFSRALVEASSGGGVLGWRTICAVEWEPYAASVLAARQNDGLLPPFPVWDDVRTFDGRPWRGRVDVVSGGFPCQDISVAGKGAGIDGARSGMWAHMARIVGEVRPRYVFVENSPALLTRGLGRVLGDLAALGYDCRWTVLGAADVGAPHQRDRFWLVATDADSGDGARCGAQPCVCQGAGAVSAGVCEAMAHADSLRELQPQGRQHDQRGRACNCGADVAHPDMPEWRPISGACDGLAQRAHSVHGEGKESSGGSGAGCEALAHTDQHVGNEWRQSDAHQSQGRRDADRGFECADDVAHAWGQCGGAEKHSGEVDRPEAQRSTSGIGRSSWWESEPDVGRVADGVAARVDRLKAIGNGQVPLCAATAWRLLT